MTLDGDILLGGGNDRLFGVLCDGIGHPEWKTDPRFITNTLRVANRVELDTAIEAITSEQTTQHWLEVFEGSGMPYSAVNDIQDTLSHRHVLARDMVKQIEHEWCGPIKMVNTPVKYSESQPSIREAPPVLGQHTDEILMEVLGMSKSDVNRLREEGSIR